jgi:adenylate kinase family enzyme
MLRRVAVIGGKFLGQKPVCGPVVTLPRCCAFSTAAAKEPPFIVRSDDDVDPSTIKIPYLEDRIRQEIYVRHMTHPDQWDVNRLSQRYNTSLERTKAVIVLMHGRYEMMRNMGFTVNLHDSLGTISVEIPAEWQGLYDKYKEDTTKSMEQILQLYNESVPETKQLKMTGKKAQEIVNNLIDHERRLENLEEHREYMQEAVDNLVEQGVNKHFQETPCEVSHKGRKSIEETYFPVLFGDDGLNEVKEDLLKRIKKDTAAHVEQSLEHYQEKFGATSGEKFNMKTSPESVSRWKLALRDLSHVDTRLGTSDATRTVIRSRQGE